MGASYHECYETAADNRCPCGQVSLGCRHVRPQDLEGFVTEGARDGVSALDALRALLGPNDHAQVIHPGGHLWDAYFTFGNPATEEEISKVEAALAISLPEAYKRFLSRFNGCVLYQDRVYDQWGVRVYGTRELNSENSRWRAMHGDEWLSSYVAVADTVGDLDVLVLDTGHQSRGGVDCFVLDGNASERPGKWDVASIGFGPWLDHLVCAQGAKYWR